jgi:hypothetical protein
MREPTSRAGWKRVFEQDRVEAFRKDRYGEFPVAPDREALLARMLDDKLLPLGGAPGR